MKIGYARVSTQDQNLDMQKDALRKAGCERIIEDKASGKDQNRSGLNQVRQLLRKGDVLVVWKLDRLARSLKDLMAIVEGLNAEGIGFQSITDNVDTTTSGGKFFFHVMGALAEFERDIIRERTKAGLASARARGKLGGRSKALSAERRARAVKLYHEKETPIPEICKQFGISKPTLYAYVEEAKKIKNLTA